MNSETTNSRQPSSTCEDDHSGESVQSSDTNEISSIINESWLPAPTLIPVFQTNTLCQEVERIPPQPVLLSDSNNQTRTFRVTTTVHQKGKQNTSTYRISKVTPNIQSAPPVSSTGLGKLLILPNQITTLPIYNDTTNVQQSGSGFRIPVNTQPSCQPSPICNNAMLRPTLQQSMNIPFQNVSHSSKCLPVNDMFQTIQTTIPVATIPVANQTQSLDKVSSSNANVHQGAIVTLNTAQKGKAVSTNTVSTQQNIQQEMTAPFVGFRLNPNVSRFQQPVLEADTKTDTLNTKPNYYRDIRPSVSNLVFSSSSVVQENRPTTKSRSMYDKSITTENNSIVLTEKCKSKTMTAIKRSSDKYEDHSVISTNTKQNLEKHEEASIPETETILHSEGSDCAINKDLQTKKTLAKGKRKRKPKLQSSPSGNKITEINEFDDDQQETKKTKRRKRTKEDLESQYFGALQRTVVRKLKHSHSTNDSDTSPETPGPSNTTEKKTFTHKLEPPYRGSDYKLKQKMVLNTMSKSTENVKSHHLLKKLDPNDPDRKKSLAIFNNKSLMEDCKAGNYILSVGTAPGCTFESSIAKQAETNITFINEEDKECMNKIKAKKEDTLSKTLCNNSSGENKISKAIIKDETKQLAIADVNKTEDVEQCAAAVQGYNSHEASKENVVKKDNLQESCTPNFEKAVSNISPLITNKQRSSQENLLSLNSPSVVLKRISGITPNEPVHLNGFFKTSQLNSSPQAKNNGRIYKNAEMIASKIVKSNTEKTRRRKMRSPKKCNPQNNFTDKNTSALPNTSPVGNKDEECNKILVKEDDSCTDSTSPENCSLNETAEVPHKTKQQNDGILHKLLFNDESVSNASKSTKHNNSKSAQITKCKSAGSQATNDEEDGNGTVHDDQLKAKSDVNIKVTSLEQTFCSKAITTQPIPVFFNDKGRLIPGPMPLTSETYKYLLSKGSPVKSLLPTPHAIQAISEQKTRNAVEDVNERNSRAFKTVKIISSSSKLNDPTGILTGVSGQCDIPSKQSTAGKTVAELLKDKRKDLPNEDLPTTNIISIAKICTSTHNSVQDNKTMFKKKGVENSTLVRKPKQSESQPITVPVTQSHIQNSFSNSPSSHNVPDELNTEECLNDSNNHLTQANERIPRRSVSLSPLVAGYEDKHSIPISPLVIPRRTTSETLKSPGEQRCPITKESLKSPCIPLKIVLPSPQKPGVSGNSSPTIKLPITVQNVTGLPAPSSSDLPVASNIKAPDTLSKSTDKSTVANQANQSYAVRIGDKMYIIRPALSVNEATAKHSMVKQTSKDIPVLTSPKIPKSAKKGKATTNKDIKHKQCSAKRHKKDLKVKLKKMIKKDKTPFEDLIQSLGLTQNKDNKKKWIRKPTHKIIYSNTPSPVPSIQNIAESLPSIKQEPDSPDMLIENNTASTAGTQENAKIKMKPRTPQHLPKKATIIQIFKLENTGCKFYMHTATINFTEGCNSTYRRWFQHSDYPCTLYLKNFDTVYRIDVDSLRSGFYLVSEMDTNILSRKANENSSMAAMLSLYPPDINVLPENSLAIVVGKISDIGESETPVRNEKESINGNIDTIIRSILKLDTFQDIEHIGDQKYDSVKDVRMSPKYHSSRFYSPELFDIFTHNRNKDGKNTIVPKRSNSQSKLCSVSSKDRLHGLCESEVNTISKAHELKLKQSELYDQCEKLQDKIKTGSAEKGILLASDVARGFDSLDEFDTDASQDDESLTEPESCTSEADTLVTQTCQENKDRGRGEKIMLEHQLEQEADVNENATVRTLRARDRKVRVRRVKKSGRDVQQFRRLTRSSSQGCK